jgi:hypothetical protein
MKPLMESQFTNIGIVSALFLTILVAALQVDTPEEPSSIIWVWYIILLTLGLYMSFASTMTCALMLVYISPLEGDAIENFISIMALYAGMLHRIPLHRTALHCFALPCFFLQNFISTMALFKCILLPSVPKFGRMGDSKLRSERSKSDLREMADIC